MGQAAWDVRSVGPLGAGAVVVGSMLGIGIFLTPPLVAGAVNGALPFFAMWVVGAVVAWCGASAYAELAAMLPRAGGDYVFLREAYGRSWAFGAGAVIFGLAFSGSIAALSDAVARYQLQSMLDAVGARVDLSTPWVGDVTGHQLVGVGVVLAITLVNASGARVSVGLQALLTAAPMVLLVVVAVAAFGVDPLPPPADTGPAGNLSQAWQAVYFTFAGWPAVVYVAGEVRSPGRSLPAGMLGGVALVTALYVLLCAAFLEVFGLAGLATVGEAGSALALAVGGPGLRVVVVALIGMALLASINGTVLGGARVGYAMARDGALPVALARGGRKAPTTALWAQAAIASALLLTGGFETMLAISSLAMMVAGSLAVGAVYVLRRRWPERERPYRVAGYPLTPAVYIATSVLALVLSAWQGAVDGALGWPLAGVGVLVGAWAAHRAGLIRARTPPPTG